MIKNKNNNNHNHNNYNNNNNNNNNHKHKIKIKKYCLIISMHIYCKKCNKHTGNTFPKKLILISKNKIKGK